MVVIVCFIVLWAILWTILPFLVWDIRAAARKAAHLAEQDFDRGEEMLRELRLIRQALHGATVEHVQDGQYAALELPMLPPVSNGRRR